MYSDNIYIQYKKFKTSQFSTRLYTFNYCNSNDKTHSQRQIKIV